MGDLVNAKSTTTSANHFTIFTGDTVPNKHLGPTRDHTSNSTTGDFLHWNPQYPLTVKDIDHAFILKTIVFDYDMLNSCEVTLNIYVTNSVSVPISVAFNDTEFDQCSILPPTTISTITTTITQSSLTISTSAFASTTRSNAHQVLSSTATELMLMICRRDFYRSLIT
ncbi:unnamed protein product [Adineta steineri]|uniref:Uncharacterized protein n=1 Tax=Adineta steineri TaxID=433720 RepID=A0A815RTT9_9BILA|nr:unnamed protein product [Adineta steineri]CAF0988095.1 unnamed protein product [Adineta steineri]CAF1481742.1 unnamed protein product [Adineta steineri]CAF1638757.1 unnamed protein product [Adineta steineri]